jgi:hypothetical protein
VEKLRAQPGSTKAKSRPRPGEVIPGPAASATVSLLGRARCAYHAGHARRTSRGAMCAPNKKMHFSRDAGPHLALGGRTFPENLVGRSSRPRGAPSRGMHVGHLAVIACWRHDGQQAPVPSKLRRMEAPASNRRSAALPRLHVERRTYVMHAVPSMLPPCPIKGGQRDSNVF